MLEANSYIEVWGLYQIRVGGRCWQSPCLGGFAISLKHFFILQKVSAIAVSGSLEFAGKPFGPMVYLFGTCSVVWWRVFFPLNSLIGSLQFSEVTQHTLLLGGGAIGISNVLIFCSDCDSSARSFLLL